MKDSTQEKHTSSTRRIARNTVVASLVWKFLERGGVQGVQLVLSIVLARLVSPDDYGVIALVLVFIQIAAVFVQSGFNTALIQKKDSDEVDFSSIFFLSLFVASLCYLLLFAGAPLISGFYNNQVLTPVVRTIGCTLFFGAANSVQGAYVSKTMQFKRFFFSSMGAVVGSGMLGVVLAYQGFGVWALVWQQLAKDGLVCMILWFTVDWKPRLLFSLKRIRVLFGFGWKLLCSALLDTVFRNVYSLVIGRIYSSAQLGVYNRGHQFPQVIATNLDGSIQSVMLPTISAHNDNVAEVKKLARRSISTSAYLLMPCMFGMAAIATPLVRLLLTEKWLGCVPFLQLACISYALYPIHTANLTAINALGRSDIFLKLEIVKKTVTVINLLITVPMGIYAMAAGQVICGFVSTFINSYPNKKLMGYSYFEQLKDIFPSLALALIMGICVYPLQFLPLFTWLCLIIQIVMGAATYVLLSKIFKLESFTYLLETIKGFRN